MIQEQRSFASNCLLARRLAERGVRCIQLHHRAWDHHGNIEKDMPKAAEATDRPSAALVKDLKQRGMLDDTLIIWGGEFGRIPPHPDGSRKKKFWSDMPAPAKTIPFVSEISDIPTRSCP